MAFRFRFGSEPGRRNGIGTLPDGIPDPGGEGVTVSGGPLTVSLGVMTDQVSYVLDAEPTANVVITLSFNAAKLSLDVSELTFTAGNFATPQVVTASAVVDADDTDTITASAASSDTAYDGISIASVSVTVVDTIDGHLAEMTESVEADWETWLDSTFSTELGGMTAFLENDRDAVVDATFGADLGAGGWAETAGTGVGATESLEGTPGSASQVEHVCNNAGVASDGVLSSGFVAFAAKIDGASGVTSQHVYLRFTDEAATESKTAGSSGYEFDYNMDVSQAPDNHFGLITRWSGTTARISAQAEGRSGGSPAPFTPAGFGADNVGDGGFNYFVFVWFSDANAQYLRVYASDTKPTPADWATWLALSNTSVVATFVDSIASRITGNKYAREALKFDGAGASVRTPKLDNFMVGWEPV